MNLALIQYVVNLGESRKRGDKNHNSEVYGMTFITASEILYHQKKYF